MSSASRFINPDAIQFIELLPGVTTKVLTGLSEEKMMMVLTTIAPGVSVPAHAHPHEQVGMVYSGRASLRIGDQERVVTEKDIYCIPAEVEHEAATSGDDPFVAFEIFYPPRRDFVEKVKQLQQWQHE
jgi:quercetin dioxygenase-like cupin family protein